MTAVDIVTTVSKLTQRIWEATMEQWAQSRPT